MTTTLAPLAMGTDLVSAILQNDGVGWFCIIGLVILSAIAIAIALYKGTGLRLAIIETERFTQWCEDRPGRLEDAFLLTRRHDSSPLAIMLREAYVECEAEDWFPPEGDESAEGRNTRISSSLERVLESSMSEQQHRLEQYLDVLSVGATISPFIGLFGTVWGVLGCFQAMGAEEGASLAALAPGLSTALVTTVFGLIVAIICVILFHYFQGKLAWLYSRMDAFAQHILRVFARESRYRMGRA